MTRTYEEEYAYVNGKRMVKMMLLGIIPFEEVMEDIPELGIEELKGMCARLRVDICADVDTEETLRNLIASEIVSMVEEKKKIADYLTASEREMYADYLADNPILTGRSK